MQEKEPSVLVQTPDGQTPGVWHSFMSEKKKEKVSCRSSFEAKELLKKLFFDNFFD